MSQYPTRRKLTPGSLRGPRTAHTVLLRMAQDSERADRIRTLKEARPDLTWRRIGDTVGVSERSALQWQKTGGIEYENAKTLASLFEVDFDWLWRGPKPDTPDLLPSVSGQLDGVSTEFRGRVDQIEERLRRIEANVTARVEHDHRVEAMLTEQNEILAKLSGLLARQTRLLESLQTAADHLPDGPSLQDRLAQELRDTLARTAPPEPQPPDRS
jgi:uncharacterized coiled-coil protein SlyX